MMDLEPGLIVDLLRQSMDNGRSPFLNVVSDSMSPLIRSGDQVQLGPVAYDMLQPGDVVLIRGIEDLITHRFWGFITTNKRVQLITKGDRPQHFDPLIDADTLVGLVIGRRRKKRLLKLRQGIGRWDNLVLTRLAALDIRLFSQAIQLPTGGTPGPYSHSGVFATTTRENPGHLAARRFIYGLAKIVNFVAQLFDESIEDS